MLVAGLGYVVGYAALLSYFYATDRALFEDMVRLYLLTLLAGREPAMFAVYQEPSPVPLHWMLIVAILDDVGTLLLTLPWVWYAYQRLRGVWWLEKWVIGVEKAALEHRAWIRKWGLAGLAAFYWVPGLGSGVLAICMMGVMAHIPLGRLVPTLILSAAGVAAFWAIALHETSGLLPSGPAEYVPALVLIGVILAAAVAVVRRHRTAHILLLEWPVDLHRAEALRPFGLTPGDGIWSVDSERLAREMHRPGLRRAHARTLAELLILEEMTPEEAESLRAHGVGGILDLGVLDPGLVAQVLAVPRSKADAWVTQARRLGVGVFGPGPAQGP